MKTNYGLHPISEEEMCESIPKKYHAAFGKLDNVTQCFLVANPDQCEAVATLAFEHARHVHSIALLIREKRDAGMKWRDVEAELLAEHGIAACESTLRRWLDTL